jgi:ABC-type amino acid transport substrate-binding protein
MSDERHFPGAHVNFRSLFAGATLLMMVPQAPFADTLARVQSSGIFKIGYRVDARPFSYRAASGEPAGYVVELCREVAAAVRQSVDGGRLEIGYVVVDAQNRFSSLRDGAVDIVCDSSSITMGRREIVDFSLPTFVDGAGLLYRGRDDLLTYENLRDKRVGVIAGTTTEPLLQSALSGLAVRASITRLANYAEGIDRLLDQTLDAFMGDRSILASLLKERAPGSGLRLSKSYFSYEIYALVLPKGDEVFRLLVDRTLARLYRNGRIKALLTRTFGDLPDDPILENLIILNSIPD